MTVVRLIPEKVGAAGLSAPTRTAMASADNYIVRNNGTLVLHFLKTGAGAANITIITPGNVGGNAIADRVIVVAATTGDVFVSGLAKSIYNDVVGDIDFSTDEDTAITVAAIIP